MAKNEMNFLKNGKRTLVTIKVTDEDKAFDFFGKAMYNRLDTSEFGFEVEDMYLSEDRYKESINEELRQELFDEVNKHVFGMVEAVNTKLGIKKQY